MAGFSGWDPGLCPTAIDGKPTTPAWMGGVGLGQLQILSLQAVEVDKKLSPFVVGKSIEDLLVGEIEDTNTEANGTKYVLRVRDPRQATKLLNMKELFDHTAVTVVMHPTSGDALFRAGKSRMKQMKNCSNGWPRKEWWVSNGSPACKTANQLTRRQSFSPSMELRYRTTSGLEHCESGPEFTFQIL